MKQKGNARHFFAGGNTAQGFYSFFDSVLENLDRIFILKGGPGTGKATLIKKVGQAMIDRGYDIEYLHCAFDNSSLDGVIIPSLRLAVVDGTAPHVIDPKLPGAVDEIVNLGECWDTGKLIESRQEIKNLTDSIRQWVAGAYELLQEAMAIQDEWKRCLSDGLDWHKVNLMADNLVKEIFPAGARVRHQFGSAITPAGLVHFFASLTEDCQFRYILKGPPGTGKSVLLRKIAQTAIEKGYGVDIYHCSFDPDSIDMIVIPALGVAVVDGSPPHVFNPQRPGDRLIDMTCCFDQEVLTKNAAVLTGMEEHFAQKLAAAVDKVNRAKKIHDDLEAFYIKAMDFAAVDLIQERILDRILAYAGEQQDQAGY